MVKYASEFQNNPYFLLRPKHVENTCIIHDYIFHIGKFLGQMVLIGKGKSKFPLGRLLAPSPLMLYIVIERLGFMQLPKCILYRLE